MGGKLNAASQHDMSKVSLLNLKEHTHDMRVLGIGIHSNILRSDSASFIAELQNRWAVLQSYVMTCLAINVYHMHAMLWPVCLAVYIYIRNRVPTLGRCCSTDCNLKHYRHTSVLVMNYSGTKLALQVPGPS